MSIIISIYGKINLLLLASERGNSGVTLFITLITVGLIVVSINDFVYGVNVIVNWRKVMVEGLRYHVPQILANPLKSSHNMICAVVNIGPEVLHQFVLQKIQHPFRDGDDKIKMATLIFEKESPST